MSTVKIIEGVYGYRNAHGMVRPKHIGETVDLPKAEAARLVALGVAEYVAAETVATDPAPQEAGEQCDTMADNENSANSDGEIVGNLDPEQLKDLKMEELKDLATGMGVDTKGLNSKAKLIDAICKVTVQVEEVDADGEIPPELGAGAPV